MLCSRLMCSSNDTVLLSNLSLSRPAAHNHKTGANVFLCHQKLSVIVIIKLMIVQSSPSMTNPADKCWSQLFLPTTDETCGLQDLFLLLLLAPQVGKRVDDDTEDQVEDDDDDDEVEQQVVHHPGREQRLLQKCTLQWKITE